ncbi:MAG: HDOD domain-containing protein [Rhodothermales bacterium]|nr:HDOD domain-containing protein [Rhodothermales bacterium]MBO6780476.1 HDOD domain-containing protein [Rhodothermales bacterium]
MSRLGNISNERNHKRTLGHLDLNVPPMPHTMFEAMRIMENAESADHARVVRMAENDPLVAVRLLRVVNSAYYAFSREVTDVDRAVRLIGPGAVAALVTGMNVMRLESAMTGPAGELYTRLMRHAVATGWMGQWLWSRLDPSANARTAFTAGLLQDFGRIVLVYSYPEDAIRFYEEEANRSPDAWLAAEASVFGCSSAEAARHVADEMDFTGEMRRVLKGKIEGPLADILEAADASARAFGFAFHDPVDWGQCATLEVWDRLVGRYPARAGEPEELIANVMEARDNLQRYVHQMMSSKSGSPRGFRPAA